MPANWLATVAVPEFQTSRFAAALHVNIGGLHRRNGFYFVLLASIN